MAGKYKKASSSRGAPFSSLKDVSPSNTVDLPDGVAKGLLVTVDGDLVIIAEDDTLPVTAFPVVAGQVLNVRVKRVKLTGTTATVKAGY